MKQKLPPPIRSAWKVINQQYHRGKVAIYQTLLQEIEQSHKDVKQTILFPPGLDWRRQLFQRPQQLATALASQGALIFYIQPRYDPHSEPFHAVQNRLYLCSVPVETFNILDHPTIHLLTWNYKQLEAFKSPKVIYDVVDEIQAFEGDQNDLLRAHQELLRTANFVLTTAQLLYEQVSHYRPDALLCPNGVDYQHFHSTLERDKAPPPEDLQPIISTGKPIIGYHGVLAEWFDYELMFALATNRPDLFFVIIGPDYWHTIPVPLLQLPNLCWLGSKSYEQLPDYLRCFDIGIIPFRLNQITHATSPIKLFETMAAGKPIVTTPMHESLQYKGVLVASNPMQFSDQLDQARVLKHDREYLNLIDRTARENTWDLRARQILEKLETG